MVGLRWLQVLVVFISLIFPQHLTTVEEASGITGGVRCLGLSRYSLSTILIGTICTDMYSEAPTA